MRMMSCLGAGKTDGLIRNPRFAARLSPLRAAPLLVFPRAMRRGGLSMIALAVIALPAAPAALASSAAAPTWSQQAPTASPPARFGAPMAYDAATHTIVLFGGEKPGSDLGGTWTWDGSTWAKQAPAAKPPDREGASMAYDAATHTIVLFGGFGNGALFLGDTWTWGGSG
jgi:hypothetical protein